MKVKVLYFAAVRDLTKTDEEDLDIPNAVTSLALFADHLVTLRPELAGRLENVRFACNEVFANLADAISEGDTIALIPPVAGG